MSIIWWLVSILPTTQAILLVVVGRENVCNKVPNKIRKKRGVGRGSQLFSRLDKLVDSVSTKSECTSSVLDKKGCSIEEVMKEFHSIEEVVFGSELYCFATEFFMVWSRREMWATIGDMDRKFQWLKLMFDRRANYRPWSKFTFDIGKTYSYVCYCVLYVAAIKFCCVLYVLVIIVGLLYLKCFLMFSTLIMFGLYPNEQLTYWMVMYFFAVKSPQKGEVYEVLLRL